MDERKQSAVSGFTLVELLVVFAISAVALSLVGPMFQDQLEKSKASQEWSVFCLFTKNLRLESFFSGSHITLVLEGNKSVLTDGNGNTHTELYKYLDFGNQRLVFNPSGYPDVMFVNAHVRNTEKTLSLVERNEVVSELK
jgi:prepilin-type N-terminal cleavage/methylation domain-containing protein